MQHKDKIIECLHTKLNQRPETPSSCQALSETTDPSDRTSPVSDECRTNEDLELCSDLDSREYQEEHRLQQPGSGSERDGIITAGLCSPAPCAKFSPIFSFPSSLVRPSVPSVRQSILTSSSSCPNMLCSATVGLNQSRGTPLTAGFELRATFLFLHFLLFCLQPLSVNASPPPVFLPPLALTSGVRKLLLTPDHGPSLSSLLAQSWIHCTKR